MTPQELVAALAAAVPGAAIEPLPAADADVTPVLLVERERILDVCRALQGTAGLEYVAFSDVTAADYYPHVEPRFEVVYHLVSPHRRARVRVKIRAAADTPVPSITSLFPGAGWPERELYDLFGIVFEGHEDLRRLMMPDDWDGHPLRKDYPVQLRKDAQTYMPLEVTEEEFRANLARDRYHREGPGAEKKS